MAPMKPRIEVQGVAKKYCRSLRRSMRYGLADISRDLLGFNVPSATLRRDEHWALEDLTVAVEPGECLGVIGPNGAGKSTLLKLLAGIFPPDRGYLRVAGRVGSLIEVGAGFHPLLSGRENVYINGSILGMSRREIDLRFDSIITFAGLEEYIDSPVKHYSSGMYVRLGFAVAAHANPDVLLVDESLAVGDIAFSMRCLNRIAEIRRNGTSVLFVSHNEIQVRMAATKCLLITNGRGVLFNEVDAAFARYSEVRGRSGGSLLDSESFSIEKGITIRNVNVQAMDEVGALRTGATWQVLLDCFANQPVNNVDLELRFWNPDEHLVAAVRSSLSGKMLNIPQGSSCVVVLLHSVPLNPGAYRLAGGFWRGPESLGWSYRLAELHVAPSEEVRSGAGVVTLTAEFSSAVPCTQVESEASVSWSQT